MKLPLTSSLLLALTTPILCSRPQQPLPLSPNSGVAPSTSHSPSKETSRLLSLHKHLVQIPSITLNESAVAKYLTNYLKTLNLTVETQLVSPATSTSGPRKNVYAYIGSQRQTRVLISSHIDTVPPYYPYYRQGNEIWGRGSVDAKGSVAAQISAVSSLLSSGKVQEGDIALLFVVGEEDGGDGMKSANSLNLSWESVIFGEPTEGKLACGHKGIISVDVRAKGKAGHSGYPELGRNANVLLVRALRKLLEVELPRSEKYGNTTLNIGLIEGGVAKNVIAEEASAGIAIRIAAGGTEAIEKIIRKALEEFGEDIEVGFGTGYGPVDIDCDVSGFETLTVNYGTDIPNLQGDHKRYLYGPGTILMAHSDHEHLEIKDLEEAVEGYKVLIEYALGEKSEIRKKEI